MLLAMTPQPYRFTVDAYLAFERASDEHHDYLDGVIDAATSACRAIESGPGNAVRPGGSRQRKRESVMRCAGVCERGAATAMGAERSRP